MKIILFIKLKFFIMEIVIDNKNYWNFKKKIKLKVLIILKNYLL